MTNLGIITINSGRKNILRLWCSQIQRLRVSFQSYIPTVVVSDETDKRICDSYHVQHIVQQDNPRTEKFNRAFQYMKSIGVDAVMVLGSDDIISNEYLTKTLNRLDEGYDLIGTTTAYFYCAQGVDRGQMVRLDGKALLGIGKTIHKSILDQCDWRPWHTAKNWGMDAIAQQTFSKYVKNKALIEDVIVDVKTRENLNSFRIFKRRNPVEPEIFYNILSDEELQILKSL